MTRTQHIVHICNGVFSKTQFSLSYPKNGHFAKSQTYIFLPKSWFVGQKSKFLKYPKKLPMLTYSSYKYHPNRIKTRQMLENITRKSRKNVNFVTFWPNDQISNTVLGYKKGSKTKSDIGSGSATQKMWVHIFVHFPKR